MQNENKQRLERQEQSERRIPMQNNPVNIDEELEYTLHYNYSMEYSVIGGLFIDPLLIDRISKTLSITDFIVPICRDVYEAALKARAEGKMLDPVEAEDVIRGKLDGEPAKWLADCINICPAASQAELHAEYVHNTAKEREFAKAVKNAMSTKSGEEMVTEIAGVCQDYMQGRLIRTKSISQVMQKLFDSFNKPMGDKVDTGFERLDSRLKGMRGGNLIVVAARPSVGKSVWAQNVALNISQSDKKVLLYSLEMSDEELGERILAKKSSVDLGKITDRSFDMPEWKLMYEAASELCKYNLLINDDPSITVSKIRSEARTLSNLGLIIIDFLTLMKSESRYDSRNLEVGAISRELKVLASELEIPIMILCQLNRNYSEWEKPTLAALRDSGEIEQNANKVIFLWNIPQTENSMDDPEADRSLKGVYIAKNRQGQCGAVQMKFEGSQMKFLEVPFEEEDWKKYQSKSKKKVKGEGMFE